VVGDVKYTGLAGDDPGAVYMPYAQWSRQGVNLVVRTRGSSGAAMADVQRQLLALDPDVPLANVETMRARMWAAVGQPRYWAALAGVFAVVGVLLAAVGIYGVLSYMVNRRTRDIGVRMALGANAVSVWRMVVGRGMVQAVVGTGIGLIATVLLTRGLGSLLFQVSPTDPAILAVTSVVLLVIALLACFTPARRATRVDPVKALSAE
jgi:ABC-type antimicrobial peptide transport system permease subunit